MLVSGSHGLIGSAVRQRLLGEGHSVWRLVRSRTPAADEVAWDPAAGTIDAAAMEGFDAVVHLAGESVAGRWTPAKMARIRDSRVAGTSVLAEALARLERPPEVLACASAVGYYGDRGDEVLTESSPPGDGFLADVCRQWEAACAPGAQRGIRVANLRLGMVLSAAGGALAQMLPIFRAGLGGRVGSGEQNWSWIALDDVAAGVIHVLRCGELSGPINVAAPQPVTNADFTRALAGVLHRPAALAVPAFAARLVLGRMAQEVILASARVRPERLSETGFTWRFPQLPAAMEHALGKERSEI